jgi:hypothetical protein
MMCTPHHFCVHGIGNLQNLFITWSESTIQTVYTGSHKSSHGRAYPPCFVTTYEVASSPGTICLGGKESLVVCTCKKIYLDEILQYIPLYYLYPDSHLCGLVGTAARGRFVNSVYAAVCSATYHSV